MHVTLTNTASITADLVATVHWAGAAAREFGTAEVTIPRDNSAFSASYVDHDGGSLVEIKDGSLGTWRGIVTQATIGKEGARLSCAHLAKLVDLRVVSRNRVLIGMTAGAIVKAAVSDAVIGLSSAVLRAGTFVEAAPVIDRFEFTGQKLSAVLADMMEQSGQEWSLSDDGALSWIPPAGTLYSLILCEEGDVLGPDREADINERTEEVIGRGNDGRETSIRNSNTGLWPKQDVLSATTSNPAIAARQAAAAAQARSTSQVGYPLRLHKTASDHWATIREGDTIQCVLPYAGFAGATPLQRVLARSYTDGDADVELRVQNVPAYSAETIFRAVGEAGPAQTAPPRSQDADAIAMVAQAKDDVAALDERIAGLEQNTKNVDAGQLIGNLRLDAAGNVLVKGGAGVGGGVGVVSIPNATTVPVSNPALGGLLYVTAGALTYRGSSATVTTVAPAEPHCPTCGGDFVHEWRNEGFGHLIVCLWCYSAHMKYGVVKREPTVIPPKH